MTHDLSTAPAAQPSKALKDWKLPFWWVWVLVGTMMVANAASTVIQQWKPVDIAFNAGLIPGALIGSVIAASIFYGICLLFGLIARKSRLVVSISLALLATLSTAGNSFSIKGALDGLSRSNLESEIDRILSKVESENIARTNAGITDANYIGMERAAAEFRDLASQYHGIDRLSITVNAIALESQSLLWRTYTESLVQMQGTWPFEAHSYTSIEDIGRARDDIARWHAAAEDIRVMLEHPDSWLRGALESEGVAAPEAELALIRGFKADAAARQLQIETFELDMQLSPIMYDMLDFLEARWDTWDYVAEDDIYYFETDEDAVLWNEFLESATTLSEKQLTINNEYLNALKATRK